jgi:hypothetical protein
MTSGALRQMLRPPAGLVLGLGLVVVLGSLLTAEYQGLRDGAPFFAVFTAVCWLLLGLGQVGSSVPVGGVSSQDLNTVRQMRNDMEARVRTLAEDSPVRTEFAEVLARLDREVIPQLAQLCAKHEELGRRLQQYDRASPAYRPDAPTLERLRALHARQQGVIQGLVQQVVTMDAALLGLIQEGDEQRMIGTVRKWAEEIDFRWQGVAEVLRDEPLPTPPAPRPKR